jgi:alpha-1,3-mannosyltransferase
MAETQEAEQKLPELTLTNLFSDVKYATQHVIFDPDFNGFVLPAIWLIESLLVKIIRIRVPYTEIDYTAYMEQIAIIQSGELDYENIYGGTGPLVYPAGHVVIYKFMNWVTKGTSDVAAGQQLFSWLYLLNLLFVLVIYSNLRAKPWIAMLLMLSKRLHSIYILRLFNDCFTTLFMVLTVLALQYSGILKRSFPGISKVLTNIVAPSFFSSAISIKMNALLYLPGFILIVYFLNNEVLLSLIIPVTVIVFWQILIASQFLFNGSIIRDSYFSNAFNFGRKFLYKWTVNFRFLDEDTFSSECFHRLLLGTHVLLILFFLFTKWIPQSITSKPITKLIRDGFNVTKPTLSPKHIILDPVQGPRYIMGVLASCNLIGVLCARSLHYQFLSWYAWAYPYLIGSCNTNIVVGLLVWLVHEWCWNAYPSTVSSSLVLLGCNVTVLGFYWFSSDEIQEDKEKKKK